jgi:membrane-bound lytic murein transglycosylase F
MRVEVVVPPLEEDLLEWLVQGRGDVVAAGLTPNEEYARQGVAFSRPYNTVQKVVVMRPLDGIDTVEDLAGRTIYLPRRSRFWNELERLRTDSGVDFGLRQVRGELDVEEIIGLVADGRYDLTVAYSHVLDIERTWRPEIRGSFALGEPEPLVWCVRQGNPRLLEAINAFLDQEHRGLFYNVVYKRYFEDPKRMRRHQAASVASRGALSPWDEIVQRHAALHGFDWRLIVAQMYQESRFDPGARSFAGAVGLLQVMPATAYQMGIEDVMDPESNIAAGVKYLAWLRDRFSEELSEEDRLWFVLASYNAGPEHVRDARRLAAARGLNPDRWFDNVEEAMQLLSRGEYARSAQHGYCRGSEPVDYVREILARYKAYREAAAEAGDTAILRSSL